MTIEVDDGAVIVFPGEWTLEPKFYLSKNEAYRLTNGQRFPIEEALLKKSLDQLTADANEKGWVIVH